MNENARQSARKFVEYWTFQRGSEKGEDQQFWNSLLGEVLGMADVKTRIKYQVPVPMAGGARSCSTDTTTKFLDAWIPETRVLIEHKSRGVKLDAPQSGHDGKTPFEQALEYNIARPFSEKARWIVTCNFDEIWVYDLDRPLDDPQKIRLSDLPRELARLGFLVDSSVKSVREKEKDISIKAGRIVGELYKALLKRCQSHAEGKSHAEAPRGGERGDEILSGASPRPPDNLCGLGLSAPLRETSLAALNRLCVRLVFCFYAEDAEMFPKDAFWTFLKNTPAQFLRGRLAELFKILDTKPEDRPRFLDDDIAVFPYTNGGLFAGAAKDDIPPLTEEIRQLLIRSSDFDWRDISPTIFGALFESTLNPVTRRAGGMVYTSVENIHKVIDPLFLGDLTRRVEEALGCLTQSPQSSQSQVTKTSRTSRTSREKLLALQAEMAALTFLDPACGSGNFLTETYICLRRLENRIIAALQRGQREFDLGLSVKVSIAQFHGIEINDFAVAVAKTALWIAEAQMLQETAQILHREPDYLPLRDYANIVEGNALRMDWGELLTQRRREAEVSPERSEPQSGLNAGCAEGDLATKDAKIAKVYVIGNPPFCGKSFQSQEQKDDMAAVFNGIKDYGNLDYVTCWFKKAADFMRILNARTAFVATNSICQGIAVAPLWSHLLDGGMEIDFAWRTFRWDSEAFDKAHVHCVIVGFHAKEKSHAEPQRDRERREDLITGASPQTPRNLCGLRLSAPPREIKTIFDGDRAIPATNINAYLIDAPHVIVSDRAVPLCSVPPMSVGSFATDGGNLILSGEERDELLAGYPAAEPFVRPYYSPEDFINNKPRFCLWLKGVPPDVIMAIPPVRKRVEAVREFRLASKKAQTRKRADSPTLFTEDRQPESDYLLIPRVSSERRRYVPIGFLPATAIAGDTITLPDATPYHFGVVVSSVHMAWMRLLCGRMKSDYRYSPSLVYNTLPWPDLCDLCLSAPLREKITRTAQSILDVRAKYPGSSYKALYDDTLMPADLRAAHEANDRAVLAAYGLAPDTPEPEIVAHLFKRYAEMTKMGRSN